MWWPDEEEYISNHAAEDSEAEDSEAAAAADEEATAAEEATPAAAAPPATTTRGDEPPPPRGAGIGGGSDHDAAPGRHALFPPSLPSFNESDIGTTASREEDGDDSDSGGDGDDDGDESEKGSEAVGRIEGGGSESAEALSVARRPVAVDGVDRQASVARLLSSEDGGSEHFDTLGPLTGDIEMGGVRGTQHNDQEATAAAPQPRSTVVVNRRGSHRRASQVLDLATGKKGGGTREHYARVRSLSSGVPLAPGARRNRALAKFFQLPAGTGDESDSPEQGADRRKQLAQMRGDDELRRTSMHGRIMVSTRDWDTGSHSQHTPFGGGSTQHTSGGREGRVYEPGVGEPLVQSEGRQYRLEAVSARKLIGGRRKSCWYNLLTCFGYGRTYNIYDDPSVASDARAQWTANALVIRYLYWTFRSNFMAVFLSAAVAYFFVITMFALGIWSIASRKPSCVTGVEGGIKPDAAGFSDSWQLSYTTFSTAGYGAILAGSSTTETDMRKCTGMTILTSLEAFCGMLFASLCCAILFARIGRAQSYAQVTFSDPMVIRFGRGVGMDGEERGSDDERDSSDAGSGENPERINCPVLEFRLVNRLFAFTGGEIMDATLNTIASIDASQACPSIRHAAGARRRGKKGKTAGKKERHRRRVREKRAGVVLSLPENRPLESTTAVVPNGTDSDVASARDPGGTRTAPRFVDEDPTGNLVPRRIFTKLHVDPPDHPFFKRVWIVRHVLDQDSPLLKAHARVMVCNNGGYWPSELSSYDGVRAAVSFEQILVSMTGTSNADANTVYAQKVYDIADVIVGYRFANMLYRDSGDESLQVDLRLLNDVTDQAGGGGEPLDTTEAATERNVMMF